MSENVSQNKVSILKPEDNYLMNFKLDESKVGMGFVMQSTKQLKVAKMNDGNYRKEVRILITRQSPN